MTDKKHVERSPAMRQWLRVWRVIRPAVTVTVAAVVVAMVVYGAIRYVLSHYVYPVDRNDSTPIEVVIPSSSSASAIANILYTACGAENEGLIVSTASFKVYVDFVGKANSLKAGTYVLSKNMSIAEIVDVLAEGNPPRLTMRFTVPEGYTVENIAALLVEQGCIPDSASFLSLCKDATLFSNYAFIAELGNMTERTYVLEGYLFPDTYEIYVDATPEEIIRKMLDRFDEVFTDAYLARAAEMELTMDQVVTLASIIEREAAVVDDMFKVSAVFRNRMAAGMQLESCATLSYALGVNKYVFTSEEMDTVSPFNTYRNKGLPIGPISNPGTVAIEAALYPNSQMLADGYLYFCNRDPHVTSELVFAATYEEHERNVETYRPYWN